MTMHDGHRQRMRERYRKEGLDGFAPHEVIELLLFYARARGDVNPLAHHLLDVFGSLKGVLEAGHDQLMAVKGVGEETATLLSLILPLFRKYQEALCAEQVQLRNCRAAMEYCQALTAGLRHERMYVISLSTAKNIIGCRMVDEGSLTEVSVYPRRIVETALNHNAHAVILCHNHPGGVAQPSREDIEVTQQIEALLSHLGILLLDHIIVAPGGTCSMNLHDHLRHASLQAKKAGVACQEDELEYVWRSEGESNR